MNDIFNIRRFGKYLASDAASCAANYGLSMLLISLMGLIIYAGTVIMGLIFTGEWSGPELGFRFAAFAVSAFVLMMTMPVKCYGRITEKRFGSEWLMVPASSFEKFLSITVMTVVVMPLAVCGVYLCVDAILCALDPTCGNGLFSSFKGLIDGFVNLSIATNSDMAQYPALAEFIKQVSCPWLYVDDVIGLFLTFAAGAVLFKKNKTVKTILAFIGVSAALGSIVAPFANSAFQEFASQAFMLHTPEGMNSFFSHGIFQHAALIDTVNDTVANIALLAIIYFRIKTLKH